MEFIDDRLRRLGGDFNIALTTESGYFYNGFKSGGKAAKSLHNSHFVKNPVTELRTCEQCSKVSTPKKVQERCLYDLYRDKGKLDYSANYNPMLCMSCYNKVKPILKAAQDAEEIRILIRKLTEERRKWQRLQQQQT